MLHSKGKILPKITLNGLELTQQFSSALRKEMHQQYWTAKMLADSLSISERTVKDWLSGIRLPNGEDLLKLMKLSAQIRKFTWETTQAEKQYMDAELLLLFLLSAWENFKKNNL